VAEGVVGEVKVAAFEQRPGDVVLHQPGGEPIGLEGAAIEHVIVGVDLGN